MKFWISLCTILLATAVSLTPAAASSPASEDDRPGEYQLKAYFLFNFAKFVMWPDDPNHGQAEVSPLVFGILGENPFGQHLEQVITNETIGGRQLVVLYFPTLEAFQTCDVLFITRDFRDELDVTLQRLANQPTLTVGDSKGFLHAGGMVNFNLKVNKISFEVNLVAVEQAGLQVSSKLLRLAERIHK